jgi:DNA polymerase I
MRYLVIDTSYLTYRSYFAFQNMKQGDQPIGALYGFAKAIVQLYNEFQPDDIIFTCDLPVPTWRHIVKDDYKAGRSPMEEDMRTQIPFILDWIATLTSNKWSVEGYEADDLIYTFVRQKLGSEWSVEAESEDEILIFSADKDLYQLLQWKGVSFVILEKGKQPALFNHQSFIAKYDLQPVQWLDYKAMVGDGSDNLSGIPGIGPKNAIALLHAWGSLQNLCAHLKIDLPFMPISITPVTGIVTEKQKTLFLEHTEALWSTYKLSQLHWVPNQIHQPSQLHWSAAQAFLKQYQMKSLVTMIQPLLPQTHTELF